MVKQAISSTKNLDKRITKAQNLSICLSDISHTNSAATAVAAVQTQILQASVVQTLNQAITKVPITAKTQMAAPIQPSVETPILVEGHTNQKKSSLGKPCFPIASFGSISSISTLTITLSNGPQSTMQSANRVYGTNE